MSRPIVGIDLGTSNTCVARFDAGKSEIIHNRYGDRTTPSAVLYSRKGDIAVGANAQRSAVLYPELTAVNVKRLVGRAFDSDEVRLLAPTLGYKLFAAPNGDTWLQIENRKVSPVEVQARILSMVRADASAYFAAPVEDAVITVPAFFDETQRQATRDAAEIAGLKALRILSEPTAAALAYGYSQNDKRNVVVFDLGGGTFDVTVISIGRGLFNVLSTDGDLLLGGVDFDRVLAHRFNDDIRATFGVDALAHPISRQRVVAEAERVKRELSAFGFVDTGLQHMTDGVSAPINFERRTDQAEFRTLVSPLLERLAEPCHRALASAGISAGDVDEVLAVGGMTRCPAVQDKVAEIFGRRPLSRVNPDEAIALGAAIQAGIVAGQVPKTTVIDVAPRTLGLRTANDVYTPLIGKATPLPATGSKTFRSVDGRIPSIEVLQGENPAASQNRRLAWVDVPPVAGQERGVYTVTFSVSEHGLLTVTAQLFGSKTQLQADVRPSSGLERSQLEKLKDEISGSGTAAGNSAKKSTRITFF